MKRFGGSVVVFSLLLVFAFVEIRAVAAQGRRGTLTYSNGSYEGEIRNGTEHGRGTFTWHDGSRYEGDWRNGKRTGHGTYTWPDGTRHVGEFRNSKAHGRGTRNWPSGSRYEGDWRDGNRTGHGTYTWADGERHVGQFRNNKAHGRGTRNWPSGSRYEGDWRDGNRTGHGTYTWANGERHVGGWRDDKMHGQGTYTYADGRREVGEWRDGERVENQPTRSTQRQRGGQEGEQQRRADRTTPRERPFPPGIPHLLCVADHSDLNGFGYSFEFTGWTTDEKGRPVGIFRYGSASGVYTKSKDEWTWKWSDKRVLANCYVCSENGTFTSYIFDSSSAVAGCCTYLCRHFETLATKSANQYDSRIVSVKNFSCPHRNPDKACW